jgi:hypothetical protein
MRTSSSLVVVLLMVGACSAKDDGNASTPDAPTVVDPTWFAEVGAAAGLGHRRAESEYGTLQGRMSGGVCVFDADGDARLDLFFPGSSASGGGGSHLYLARGAKTPMTFADEAKARGLADTGDGGACLAFDVEGDGDLDVLTSGLGGARLFLNDGKGTFTGASDRLGKPFAADAVTTSAIAFDADSDGDLDLAIGTYGRFVDPGTGKKCNGPCVSDILQYAYGSTVLLLQNDDGTFQDVSDRLGKLAEPSLVLLATDLDEDGKLDLFVGNDIARFSDRYFRGDGTGKFTEVGESLGVAYNARKSGIFSMSAADEDVDGDGHLDLAESSWADEPSTVYRCAGSSAPGSCADIAESLELFRTPANFRWGQVLVDLDDDGIVELFEAMGHYQIETDTDGILYPTSDVSLLWHRTSTATPFVRETKDAGIATKTAGRGAIAADLDGDGDLDVVVGTALGSPLLLENVRAHRGHALAVKLAGKGKNRFAIGARVVFHASGKSHPFLVHAGSGFMSSGDTTLHLGLGTATKVDAIDVTWPSGKTSHLADVPADVPLVIDEP